MARTKRERPKGRGTARDGDDLRPSRGCRHHGPCSYCERNRTHSNARRAPIQETER